MTRFFKRNQGNIEKKLIVDDFTDEDEVVKFINQNVGKLLINFGGVKLE